MSGPHRSLARLAATALIAASALIVGGCYEELTPTRYEAGVYKGSPDPLTAKLDAGELQGALRERFQMAAQDR